MAVAEWYKLHEDILKLISEQIENQLDLINFRLVCSSWHRSSISVNHRNLPFKFNLPPNHTDHKQNTNTTTCYLSKHTLFLIKPLQKQQKEDKKETLRPWLIRIAQNSNGKNQLIHPLLSRDYPLPYNFSHVLDFTKFSVVQLGNDFILDIDKHRTINKLVAVTWRSKDKFIIGILNSKGHPELFRCGDDSWKLITNLTSMFFHDICVFKGQFYVVTKSGRTFAIEPEDCSIRLGAQYVVQGGGDMKFLVESEGDLLLVDIYDRRRWFGFLGEDDLKLDVFRLEENEKRWVKLTGIGDRVLFLGKECSFSASAEKEGNCVVFIDDAFFSFDFMDCGKCVFHLGECRLTRLSENPHFSNLFWSPPEWIVKSCRYEKEYVILL